MPRHPLTIEDLWSIPRVGGPVPSPDGSRFIVPVTTWSMETNEAVARLWLVSSDATAAGASGASDAARPLTMAEMNAGQPSWSPDGKRIAFTRKPGGKKPDGKKKKSGPEHPEQPQIWVIAADGGEAERLTDLPLGGADPKWFPDGKRLAFVAPVYADAPGLEATAKKAKKVEEEPVKVHVTEDRFYRYWDKWLTDGRVHHIFMLDLATKKITDLTPDSKRRFDSMDPSGAYEISPDGREIAWSACRTKPPHDPLLWGIYLTDVAKRKTSEITPKGVAEVWRPAYSPDGRFLVYGMQREFDFYADKVRLCTYDRRTRRHTVLTEKWDASCAAWRFGDDPHTVWFKAETAARDTLFRLDIRRLGTPRAVAKGGTFGSLEIAGGRAFALVSHIDRPHEATTIDLKSGKLRTVTAFTRASLKNVELSKVEEVHVTGAGGHPVQMFLLYPPGVNPKTAKKRFPLVHLIHGGPHGAFGDDWHWRWNPHAFAAPGYLVALVNFHGSTGWGQAFTSSILGRWGDQPYYDITVATDHLLARGLVDPKKMAVTGGSYGGYLVSWICSQTDRFACAVNHAGVSDFQTQYASDVTQGRMRSMGGEPWDRIEGMDRWNPMRHAKGFRTPMLVVHGEKDYRVPYAQGVAIYNVYKAMKLPARLVVYPDENHWILKPRNSRHWYGEVLGWLRKWLKRR